MGNGIVAKNIGVSYENDTDESSQTIGLITRKSFKSLLLFFFLSRFSIYMELRVSCYGIFVLIFFVPFTRFLPCE